MSDKYSILKYLPIWSVESKICIGIPGTDQYIEITNTNQNRKLLDDLISNGISLSEINGNHFYNELFKKQILLKTEEQKKRKDFFFDYLNIKFPSELLSYRILIFGAGAGGATIGYLLAQFGFKNISICDNDVVNSSDVEKTTIFDSTDIGKYKVFALSERVRKNFGISIQTYTEKVFSEADIRRFCDITIPQFIIKACDPNLSFRTSLNNYCFNNGIPFIHMSYAFEIINLGPLFIPGKTCCDLSLNQLAIKRFGEEQSFEKQKKLYTDYTTHPSISFNINILANLILKEILFFLTDRYEMCNTINKIVYYNASIMKGYTYHLQCNKSCLFNLNNITYEKN